MKIAEYKNVFLTRSGIGLKRFMLINETIHLYKGKRMHFWNYALFHFFFRKRIRLDGSFFVIHNHWCPGYYHWITEALPRLLYGRGHLKDHILVLPESFKGSIYDSIKPIYDGEVYWIPQNRNLILENLLIPENPPFSGVYDQKTFYQLRKIYKEHISSIGISFQKTHKIYASRFKATRRKVVNEIEVISCLEGLGFEVVNFEDYSFWQQVALMQQTEILISIHGAGLSNLLFMNDGSRVIELQKEIRTGEKVDVLYRDFAEMLGLDYRVLFCQPVEQSDSLYLADIVVDSQDLKAILLQ